MTTDSAVQKNPEKEQRLLSSEEQAVIGRIATKEPPDSQRAQALLALDKGATQAEAGRQAGLTKGQVSYWLAKFRKDGIYIFSEEQRNPVEQVSTDLSRSSAGRAVSLDMQDVAKIQDQEGAPQDETAVENMTGPDAATVQPEKKSKALKKSKKKPPQKPKKTPKKSKKAPQKPKKKSNKNKSKKAKGKKSKPGKKKRKKK